MKKRITINLVLDAELAERMPKSMTASELKEILDNTETEKEVEPSMLSTLHRVLPNLLEQTFKKYIPNVTYQPTSLALVEDEEEEDMFSNFSMTPPNVLQLEEEEEEEFDIFNMKLE